MVARNPHHRSGTSGDARLARDAALRLAELGDGPLRLFPAGKSGAESAASIEIPAAAGPLIAQVLACMARGEAVTIIPQDAELTTQQSAEILGVSRPHVIKLMKLGRLPFRLVGTHRRVRYADLVEFQRSMESARGKVLDELAQMTQQLGLND